MFLETVFDLQMQAMEYPEETGKKAKHEYDDLYQRLESIFRVWEDNRKDDLLAEVEVLLAQLNYLQKLVPNK